MRARKSEVCALHAKGRRGAPGGTRCAYPNHAKSRAYSSSSDVTNGWLMSFVERPRRVLAQRQQQTPVVMAGPSQGGMGAGELQLPAGKETRKAVSSAVHSLLARVLQRPPATSRGTSDV